MNNSDTSPGASTPHTSPNSTIAIPTGSSSSSKTNTISRGPNNRRHTQQDSSTSPYDSDMDLAVHGLHIVDSSHLHPGYKPRQRNAAPHYFHHGSADKMSSSSSSSTTTTPSPPRSQYRPALSSMNNSSHSNSSSPSEKVPRKWGLRSYPSLKQRVREEREKRDVKEGRMENARLQIGRGHNDEDGDVEMVDMDVSSGSGSHNWKAAREFEMGYDGDTEMGDVPPPLSPPPSSSSSHEVKGASCSGSNGSKGGGFHGRRKGSEMPVKYVQTEGGNTDKSTNSTGSKKRARCGDQVDEEEEKVEHKRMRSSCESRQ